MVETNRGRAFCTGALFAMALAGCAAGGPSAPASPTGRAASSLTSYLIADADFDREPSAVDAAGALADLDAALRIFDEAYAGLDGEPRLPGSAQIAGARARLTATARWEPAAFVGELRALLGHPDGHLAFGYGGHAPLRLSAVPPREQLHGSGLLSVRAEASAAPEGPLGLLLSPARAQTEPERSAPVSVSFDGVPTVAIRTFDSAAQGPLRALPDIARRLRRAPSFVVDLRGNGGGNYAFAEAFILALTDRTLHRLDEREVRSVAADEGRANSARRRLAAGQVPEGARPLYKAHIAALEADARALRATGAARAELVTRGATVHGSAPSPLEGRAIFLVDHGCASACEMMLSLARQIPGVIVAGENTYGGMAVGEVALFRLPASGVTLSLGTRAFRDPLGDFVEARGFLPDVWLDGRDPLADAQRLAIEGPAARSAHHTPRRDKLPYPAFTDPRAAAR